MHASLSQPSTEGPFFIISDGLPHGLLMAVTLALQNELLVNSAAWLLPLISRRFKQHLQKSWKRGPGNAGGPGSWSGAGLIVGLPLQPVTGPKMAGRKTRPTKEFQPYAGLTSTGGPGEPFLMWLVLTGGRRPHFVGGARPRPQTAFFLT